MMRLLSTSVLGFLVDLYHNPRSSERWAPPEWKPLSHDGRILGRVSEETWRITGMMRDSNTLFSERLEVEEESEELREEFLKLGMQMSVALSSIADAQIRLDLIGAGVSREDADYVCTREDGAVLECACRRIASILAADVYAMRNRAEEEPRDI